jgi:CrcB protein
MFNNFFLVAIGGAIGSMARYSVSLIPANAGFPWQTFCINIAGSFIIGILVALFRSASISPSLYMLFAVGLCGGFTTFSAYSAESLTLLMNNRILQFCIYTAGSVAIGITACFAGFKMAS